MLQPVYCRPRAFRAFVAAIDDVETSSGLFHGAVAISQHDRPDAEFLDAEHTIAGLADTVARRVQSPSAEARLAHLHDVLFDVVGLAGNVDDYYAPANSYITEVLRTRRGIPITLVLVYKLVAERLGLVVHGINAPGHFLAGVEMNEPSSSTAPQPQLMYVDPFYGGGLLNEREVHRRIEEATGEAVLRSSQLLARATHRQWLARMLNNLQATFAATGRERDLYAMQELQNLL
jgi:regulator of sirC expression with transglutaminase-like and TPR domain